MSRGDYFFDIRVYRFCLYLYAGRPFIRVGWNKIPNLIKSFGRGFLWIRGFGLIYPKPKP